MSENNDQIERKSLNISAINEWQYFKSNPTWWLHLDTQILYIICRKRLFSLLSFFVKVNKSGYGSLTWPTVSQLSFSWKVWGLVIRGKAFFLKIQFQFEFFFIRVGKRVTVFFMEVGDQQRFMVICSHF